jgi:hypothetical protein
VYELADITDVEVLAAHELRLTFADGTVGEVEFAGRDRRGVLEPLRDPDYFAQVRVDAELGTIAWPNAPTWPRSLSARGWAASRRAHVGPPLKTRKAPRGRDPAAAAVCALAEDAVGIRAQACALPTAGTGERWTRRSVSVFASTCVLGRRPRRWLRWERAPLRYVAEPVTAGLRPAAEPLPVDLDEAEPRTRLGVRSRGSQRRVAS